MASRGEALPAAASSIDHGGKWFWDFLKKELTPYPGRAWVVGRMTISATIVMVLVLVFRIPGGFQGAIFSLLISRENPKETFLSGFRTAVVYLIGTVYVVFSIRILIGDPLTHFLWVAGTVFLFLYLLRVIVDYGTAVPLGFATLGVISLWDSNTVDVETRLENTLWFAGVVLLAVVVTIVVEYVFRWVHPTTDLTEGIEARMQTVENVLRCAVTERPLESEWEQRLSLYGTVGISRLRRLILRSDYSPGFKERMSAVIALVGRLVDIAASFHLAFAERTQPMDAADQSRCLRLADQIAVLRRNLELKQRPVKIEGASQEEPSNLPFLQTMERTVALIPSAFAGSQSLQALIPAPMDEEGPVRVFVGDAFSNRAYVQFALRGTLAAMVCYITYTALDWPGLSTSVITCFITALSTIASSRQKQVLRLGGALIGGFIFGMGAQVFVLPYLDTIAGFTVLFAVVTAIAAWIQTSSARLSYLGVQLALAFYLINLQEFTIQTSLSIARDRVFGVLLGLVSMGIFFDLLWVKNPLDEMQAVFAHNLEMFAELAEELLEQDQIKAIRRIRQLRDQLNAGFQAVTAQSDAVLLDFGPARQRKLQIRENIRRWSPAIRALLLVQVTAAQYLENRPLTDLPEAIARGGTAFQRDFAQVMRALANEVSGKPVDAVPDIRLSAARWQQEINKHYQDIGVPVPAQASDLMSLAENLASILAPLFEDIQSTFTADRRAVGSESQHIQDIREAQS
jgi:multidrug resistance protein MdtO